MKKQIATALKMFCLVPVSGILLTLILTLCYCVPLDVVNFQLSDSELSQEGWYSDVLENRPGYDENFFSEQPGIISVFNDKMDYHRAAGYSDKSPLYNAMAMGHDGEDSYARYWHGYAGVIRILLLWFDCKEIKFLSFIFQFVLVVFIALRIRDRKGCAWMMLFLSQYFLLMPVVTSFSMVYTYSIDVSLIGLLVYERFHERLGKPFNQLLFFCIIGILTCFFEELCFGVLTWGLNILWIMILFGENQSAGKNVLSVIKTGLAWIWGYGGIWFMKWLIATPILRTNVIMDGWSTSLFRSSSNSGEVSKQGIQRILDRLSSMSLNYKYYFYTLYFLILTAWLLILTLRIMNRKLKKDTRIPALGLISLAPMAWYFVMANHTIGHRFMTHRIFNFGIFAVLSILFICTDDLILHKDNKRTGIKNNLAFKIAMISVSSILAFIIVSSKTEEYGCNNANIPGEEALLSQFEDDKVSIEITPVYKMLKTFSLNLKPSDPNGEYEFILYLGDEAVYSKTFPMSLFADYSWQTLVLNWELDTQKTYRLEIIPYCESGDTGSVLVCYQDFRTDSDVRYFSTLPGADNVRLVYWTVYEKGLDGRLWLFYFLTWFAVFEYMALVIRNIVVNKSEVER